MKVYEILENLRLINRVALIRLKCDNVMYRNYSA